MRNNAIYVWTLWAIIALMSIRGCFVFVPALVDQPGESLFGVLVGGILAAVVVGVLLRSGMWPTGRWWWFIAAILWGSVTSFGVSVPVGRAWFALADAYDLAFLRDSLAGAYPEEIMKTVGVALIILGFSQITRPWHGLVVGLIVGLGFDMFENVFFGLDGARFDPQSNISGLLSTWISRLMIGPGLHMIVTGFAGLGIGYAVFAAQKSFRWRLACAVGGSAAAFVTHSAWNLGFTDPTIRMIWAAVLSVLTYGAFIVLVRREIVRARTIGYDHSTVTSDERGQ